MKKWTKNELKINCFNWKFIILSNNYLKITENLIESWLKKSF